jgi:formate dehydrogenase major subunit
MSMNKEKDFGTPASSATQTVNLEIDGFKVTAPVGTSVMRAAASIGIDIPKLCATDSVEPFGS